MPVLNIKDPEAYNLALAVASATGKSLTRVVVDALRAEKERIEPREIDVAKVYKILAEFDVMPDLDPRSSQQIVADLYDEQGLPK
jgi:antitoxin VapB